MMGSDERLKKTIEVLDQLIQDTSVPRNVRKGAETAKKNILEKKKEPFDVRLAGAISILDELANDPNLPLHGRTLIWNVISSLETVAKLTK